FLKASTLDRLEELLAQGGRVLGMGQAPDRAFGGDGMLDVHERVERLFGVAPGEPAQETEIVMRDHPGGGRSAFVRGPKVDEAVGKAVRALIDPDVTLDNPEVMYLHRVKDERDLYF